MTEQEQVQLLPCPFCGGEARFVDGRLSINIRCGNYDCGITQRQYYYEKTAEAIAAWNTRHIDEVTKIPSALLDQSCCIGLIGKNVVIDCETRAEAEEVLDWLCDARPALTAAIAKIEGDAECDGRALAALTYQDGQRSAPDGGN